MCVVFRLLNRSAHCPIHCPAALGSLTSELFIFSNRLVSYASSCASSCAFRIVLRIVLYIVLSFSNRLVILYIVLQLQDRSLLSRLSFELSCYSTHRPVCRPTASESPCCFLNRSTHCLVHCLAASELPCRLLSCSTLDQKSCVFHFVFSEVYYEDCVRNVEISATTLDLVP